MVLPRLWAPLLRSQDVANARSTFERIEMIESKSLKSPESIVISRQICVKETKNLVAEPQRNRFLRRNEALQLQANANIPEKVVNYLLWLKKQGYAETTIFDRVKIIKFLSKNSSIDDPEAIKEYIANRSSLGPRAQRNNRRMLQQLPNLHRRNMESTQIQSRRKATFHTNRKRNRLLNRLIRKQDRHIYPAAERNRCKTRRRLANRMDRHRC